MNKGSRPSSFRTALIFLSALSPFLLPLVSQLWVRVLDERAIYGVGLFIVFFGIAYLAFVIAVWLLLRGRMWLDAPPLYAGAAGAYLFLTAFSLQFCVDLTMNPGSTGGIGFIFYLHEAAFATVVGGMVGALVGAVFGVTGVVKRPRLTFGLSVSLVALAAAGWLVSNNFGRFGASPKIEVVSATDALPLEKTLFSPAKGIGSITSLERRICLPEYPDALIMTGQGGATIISDTGELLHAVEFDEWGGFFARPVDVEGDGYCEFLSHPGGWSPEGLIDSSGAFRWRYGKTENPLFKNVTRAEHSTTGNIPFDYDGDGELEFLIPMLIVGSDEVHVLDANGEHVDTLNLRLERSLLMDVDRDGSPELATFTYNQKSRRTELQVFGKGMELLCSYAVPIPWPFDGRRPNEFEAADGRLWLAMSLPEGKGLWLANPFSGETRIDADAAEGLKVRFEPEHPAYVVEIKPYRQTTTLTVMNEQNNIVYREVLNGGGRTLVFKEEDGRESLLLSECVPGKSKECGRIWRYYVPPQSAAPDQTPGYINE